MIFCSSSFAAHSSGLRVSGVRGANHKAVNSFARSGCTDLVQWPYKKLHPGACLWYSLGFRVEGFGV